MNVLYFDKVSSTMDTLKEIAKKGAINKTVVISDLQEKARGRVGRVWFCDNDSLTFSILFKNIHYDMFDFVKLIGKSIISGIKKTLNISVYLEYPNDLIVDIEKIGGILMERFNYQKENLILVGVGLNVNNKSFPEDLKNVASSIFLKTNQIVDKTFLFNNLLLELDKIN